MATASRRAAGRLSLALAAAGMVLATPAGAGSVAQPGGSIGIPAGAQIPVGLYFVAVPNYGVRYTFPASSDLNVNTATFALSTPWSVLGARLQFIVFNRSAVSASARGAPSSTGLGQSLYATQLAWNLGNDVGVNYLLGGYVPNSTRFGPQEGSLTHRFAVSYTGNGYNLTANLLYGHFLTDRALNGSRAFPDYLNIDLTATRRFGKFEFGPVAYASADLPVGNVPGYRRQSQLAVGGLVGYNFGPVNVQAYITRDVAERHYGGQETRGWARLIVPIWQDKGEVAPNRTLVTRRQGQ
ncbi:CoxB-like protein [Methylobacterium sp. Leaf121]|nr:CoxB-like protein [Methylobacterium sp. Leaf121]